MLKRPLAIGLIIAGAMSWWRPGFNGVFFDASLISDGDGRIAAAIFIVGGLILWFLPEQRHGD